MESSNPQLLILMIAPPGIHSEWLESGLRACQFEPAVTLAASITELPGLLISRPWDFVFCESALPAGELRATIDVVRRLRPDLTVILIADQAVRTSSDLQLLSADDVIPRGVAHYFVENNPHWLRPASERTVELEPHLAERRRMRQLEILYQVSQEMARASSNAEDVYLAIHRATARLMPSEAFVISLADEARQEIEAVYLIDRGERFPRARIPYGQGLSGHVITTRKPILDLSHGDEAEPNAVYFGSGDQVRSVLAVPMWIGERIIGVLSTQSYQPDAFTIADQRLLEMLSSHAAIALENNRLFEQTQRQVLTFENMFDAVFLTDPDGRILDWNPAAERMFGMTRAEVLFQSVEMVYRHSGDPDQLVQMIGEVMQGRTFRGEMVFFNKSERQLTCEVVIVPLKDAEGNFMAAVAVHHDISARKQSEEALRKNEELLRVVLETLPVGVHVTNEQGEVILANPAAEQIWGKAAPAGRRTQLPKTGSLLPPQEMAVVRAVREGRQIHNEIINMPVNGNGEKSLLFSAAPVLGPDNNVIAGVAVTQDISAVRRIEKEREAVITVSNALRKAVHSSEIIPTVLDQLCQLLKTDTAAIMLAQRYPYELRIEAAVGAWGNMIGDRLPGDSGLSGMVFQRGEPVLNLDPRMTTHLILPGFAHLDYLLCGLPLTAQGKAIGVLWIGRCQPFEAEEVRLASAVADIAANAIQRSSLFEQTLLHAEQMATITTLGKELAEILDPNQIYERLASSVQQILPDISAVYIALFDKTNQMIRAAYGVEDGHVVDVNLLESFPLAPAGKGVQSQVIRTRAPLITNDLPGAMHRFQVVGRRDKTTRSALCVPLQAKGELLGTCMVQSTIENRFGLEEQEMLSLIGNTAAIAMMNARLFSETRTRMQHLAALRTIDVAIRSGAESKVIYNVLLDQLMAQLKVDAASVLLYDPLQKTFNYVAGRGFRSHGITRTHLRIGEGLAGKVAMQQRTAHYGNLASEGPAFTRATLLASEGFHTYTASPLVAKGQVKGVLEVFCRHSFTPDDDWIEFFETLAGDLAIALENITLFEELQRSNEELTRAYDTTLEGWAHALELRDQETEGHSKRVVAITLKLAQMMGVREEDMVHVRRGALLHDIGKMGIPDKILKKTAPLEAEEWTEMRRHPLIAFDLLSPIGYLKPALDVPLYHHERWDGQGYPYQLAGRAIPLSARIFAVVDVWDALLSNRPYRQAWSREAAIQYVQEQAGAHFDPAVVAAFMDLVNRKEI